MDQIKQIENTLLAYRNDWIGMSRKDAEALQAELNALRKVVERVARLNRDAGEIGAGMLASLVDAAREALKQ